MSEIGQAAALAIQRASKGCRCGHNTREHGRRGRGRCQAMTFAPGGKRGLCPCDDFAPRPMSRELVEVEP